MPFRHTNFLRSRLRLKYARRSLAYSENVSNGKAEPFHTSGGKPLFRNRILIALVFYEVLRYPAQPPKIAADAILRMAAIK